LEKKQDEYGRFFEGGSFGTKCGDCSFHILNTAKSRFCSIAAYGVVFSPFSSVDELPKRYSSLKGWLFSAYVPN
jgi:hypothetical protein